MKVYLLAYNEFYTPRDTMFAYLNSRPDVFMNWYSPLQGAILIGSDYDVNVITGMINEKFLGLYFFITEIKDKSYNGWLPKYVWDFINQKLGGQLSLPFLPVIGLPEKK